jgi:hypothetical protein
MQRAAGNRATFDLLTLQRLRADAVRYGRENGLPARVTTSYATVRRFVDDPNNEREHRLGLLEAWNSGQNAKQIPTPRDLDADEAPPEKGGQKRTRPDDIADGDGASGSDDEGRLSFNSMSAESGDESGDRDDRGERSVDAKRTFGERGLDVEAFRKKKVRLTFKKSKYGATSAANSNFVFAKGARDSRYKTLIPRLSRLVEGDKNVAELMLKGLLDMPAFHAALLDYEEGPERNVIQQFLALLFNEMIGRSTSNIADIIGLLQHAVKKDDPQLLDELLERGLFMPNSREHKGFGGSKLSKIGSGQRDVNIGDLDTALQHVVRRNRQMHESMFKHSGQDSREEFEAQLKQLVERFAENFMKHVSADFAK